MARQPDEQERYLQEGRFAEAKPERRKIPAVAKLALIPIVFILYLVAASIFPKNATPSNSMFSVLDAVPAILAIALVILAKVARSYFNGRR